MNQLSKLFGSVFGLSAFAVAVFAGISSGNGASQVLVNAIVCMLICYAVGTLLGMIAERTVAEHASGYAAARTIPPMPKATAQKESSAQGSEMVKDEGRTG